MNKPTALSTVFAIAITAAACDRPAVPGANGTGYTVDDSAGVEIVVNHTPEHPVGQFWTVDPDPEIVLGGEENPGGVANDSAQLIWDVVGIARLTDGRVAVLSGEGQALFLFEASGKLSATIGRAGEGPGEFMRPERLQYLPPDTLVVWDYHMTSINYFDTEGSLLRERTIDHAVLMERVPGASGESMRMTLPDGSFIVGRGDPEAARELGEPMPGSTFRFMPEEYLRVDDEYGTQSFGTWQGMEMWVPEMDIDPDFGIPFVPTFALDSHIAVGGDPLSVYISEGDRNEILQFALDGKLQRIIRRTTDPLAVTDRSHGAWMDDMYAFGEVIGEPLPPGVFDGMPRKESYPSVGGLVVDAEGYLWVREWSESEAGWPDRWSVFSPWGRWLGILAIPPEPALSDLFMCYKYMVPCWVDRDMFLTIRRDEYGVERVEGYRIRRAD